MSGRCVACDSKLSPFEITRKYAGSGEFVGLCNPCMRSVPDFPEVVERNDLRRVDDVEDTDGNEFDVRRMEEDTLWYSSRQEGESNE